MISNWPKCVTPNTSYPTDNCSNNVTLTEKLKSPATQTKPSDHYWRGIVPLHDPASAQRLLNTSLDTSLTRKSAELLTADIEIASTQALSTKILTLLATLPTHQSSRRQLFSHVQFWPKPNWLKSWP